MVYLTVGKRTVFNLRISNDRFLGRVHGAVTIVSREKVGNRKDIGAPTERLLIS